MNEFDWAWWFRPEHDLDFEGPYPTREDAIASARGDGLDEFTVMEAKRGETSIAENITADGVLEWLYGCMADEADPENTNTPEINEESEIVLAILAAVKEHDEPFASYTFAETRNREVVDLLVGGPEASGCQNASEKDET